MYYIEFSFIATKILTDIQKLQILKIWNKEYPKKLQHAEIADFDKYLYGLEDKTHILLTDEEGMVKGWLDFYKG